MTTTEQEMTVTIENTGLIFVETVTLFLDDDGAIVGRSSPHRVPYPPAQLQGDVAVPSPLPDDPDLARHAKAAWTPARVKSYGAQLVAQLQALTDQDKGKG